MPVGHVGPGLMLLAGAVIALVTALVVDRRRQWVGAPIALVAVAAAAGWSIDLYLRLPAQLTFSGSWALDGVTTWATWLILGSTAVVVLLSPRWFEADQRHGEWYALLLFSALGALMMAGAADTMELMVGMLLATAPGYALASFHRRSRMAAEAGIKYFLLGALTNPLLLLGIVILFGLAGTTRYAEAAPLLEVADPWALTTAVALVLVGIGFELGMVPTHPWVPDVAQGAPAPAAAFLTVVPKIGAVFALARFVQILPESAPWRPLVAIAAAATMTLGNLAALWQTDLRRLLGWSSVAWSGYGLMAVVALGRSALAVPSLIVFAAAYAAANLTAFGIVVALRGRTDLEGYRGLGRSRPWHALALSLALLSLIGIPPLVGFTAKLALFGAAIEAGYAWLAAVAVVNTVISVFYYLRVVTPMTFDGPVGRHPLLGRAASAASLVAAALTVLLGLGANPLLPTAATLLP